MSPLRSFSTSLVRRAADAAADERAAAIQRAVREAPIARGGSMLLQAERARKLKEEEDKIKLVINKVVIHATFSKNNTHLCVTAEMEDANYANNIKNKNVSYNQQVLYYLRRPERILFSSSTGDFGFRKAARGEYEAAYQTAAQVFKRMENRRLLNYPVEIVMLEWGKGRQAFVAALEGKEGNKVRPQVVRLSDHTKIKIGGNRAPKRRRL